MIHTPDRSDWHGTVGILVTLKEADNIYIYIYMYIKYLLVLHRKTLSCISGQSAPSGADQV